MVAQLLYDVFPDLNISSLCCGLRRVRIDLIISKYLLQFTLIVFKLNIMLFKSFNEVKDLIAKLKEQYHPLRTLCSTSVQEYNKKLKEPDHHLPSEVMYYQISYCCKHFGAPRPMRAGIRNIKHVLPSNCPFMIRFTYNKEKKGFLITKQETEHNHEIGKDLFQYYSFNNDVDALLFNENTIKRNSLKLTKQKKYDKALEVAQKLAGAISKLPRQKFLLALENMHLLLEKILSGKLMVTGNDVDDEKSPAFLTVSEDINTVEDQTFSEKSTEAFLVPSMSATKRKRRRNQQNIDTTLRKRIRSRKAQLFAKIQDYQENKQLLLKQKMMLQWFVTNAEASDALHGRLIDEAEVECDPEKIPNDFVEKNENLDCIKKFFTPEAWMLVENVVHTKQTKISSSSEPTPNSDVPINDEVFLAVIPETNQYIEVTFIQK